MAAVPIPVRSATCSTVFGGREESLGPVYSLGQQSLQRGGAVPPGLHRPQPHPRRRRPGQPVSRQGTDRHAGRHLITVPARIARRSHRIILHLPIRWPSATSSPPPTAHHQRPDQHTQSPYRGPIGHHSGKAGQASDLRTPTTNIMIHKSGYNSPNDHIKSDGASRLRSAARSLDCRLRFIAVSGVFLLLWTTLVGWPTRPCILAVQAKFRRTTVIHMYVSTRQGPDHDGFTLPRRRSPLSAARS